MSTFKLKTKKVRQSVDIRTLDETHKKTIDTFQRKRDQLPKRKKKLEKLEKKYDNLDKKDKSTYTINDIREKSSLKTEMEILKTEIFDIQNNISETEYYSKTIDLLTDYYDLFDQEDAFLYEEHPELSKEKNGVESVREVDTVYDGLDRLNKMRKNKNNKKRKGPAKRRKKNSVNTRKPVTSFFGMDDPKEKKDDDMLDKDKSGIYDEYMTMTNNEYHTDKLKGNRELLKCPLCFEEMTISQTEGMSICKACGIFDNIIIEPEKPNYKDNNVPEKPGYPYKRINHFNESTIFVLWCCDLKLILL
jgi:hypothetical protein